MEKPTLCPCCQEKEDQYQEFLKQQSKADEPTRDKIVEHIIRRIESSVAIAQ